MKYYLCIVGSIQKGGEEPIKEDCLQRNVYQYHKSFLQKGAGAFIKEGDTLIFVYKKVVLAYGVADGEMGKAEGKDNSWLAVPIKGHWNRALPGVPLPYGVFWHTLVGTKRSVVKEIDALWANDLILRITLNNDRKKMPTEQVIPLHLPTIVSFLKAGFLTIPAVQRGKVWNAVRTEVLWDSLLRGIPVGTFSIRPIQGESAHWDLLDGQQRTNAIELGYLDFPNVKSKQSDKEKAILWIDLGMVPADTEQNDGKKKNSERKFFFRVTTRAQPWGYMLSDSETKNSCFKAWQKRESVVAIGANWEGYTHKGQRPYPYELWPVDANAPVPFSVLRSFCEKHDKDNATLESFWGFCKDRYAGCNWFNRKTWSDINISVDDWESLVSAIRKLNSIVILAQNALSVDDCDIGLYFRRMNKAGIEPSPEEIRYSLLKSKLPKLKSLDEYAANRMAPSRLADIAMLSYLTEKERKWPSSITYTNIGELAGDSGFEGYVKKLPDLLCKVDRILYKSEMPIGLPKVLYSQIARGHADIYRFLMALASRGIPLDTKFILAFITVLAWFGDKYNISECYSRIVAGKDNEIEYIMQKWLYDAIRNRSVIIPPPPRVYQDILVATRSKEMEKVRKTWSNPAFLDGLNRTWAWDKLPSRGLLLYVLRAYLHVNFPNYDPVGAVWSEENCPWDYDHIFPQGWLITGRGKKQGSHHELVAKFIRSIGNISPISFSANRGKGDKSPGKYQGDDNKLLYVEYREFFDVDRAIKGNPVAILEKNEDTAFEFAMITAKRLFRLYHEWWTILEISKLLDFSSIDDERRKLFETLQRESPECEIYFPDANETQCKLSNSTDWARPGLSVGIHRKEGFVYLASDGQNLKIGVRRVENIDADKDSPQWRDPGIQVIPFDNAQHQTVIKKWNEYLGITTPK